MGIIDRICPKTGGSLGGIPYIHTYIYIYTYIRETNLLYV